MTLELFFAIWALIVIAIILSCVKDIFIIDYSMSRATKMSKTLMDELLFDEDGSDDYLKNVPDLINPPN